MIKIHCDLCNKEILSNDKYTTLKVPYYVDLLNEPEIKCYDAHICKSHDLFWTHLNLDSWKINMTEKINELLNEKPVVISDKR